MTIAQPWEPGRATAEIRSIARNPKLNISYKLHARERISERGLILSDVLHALKYGNVYQQPVPATRPFPLSGGMQDPEQRKPVNRRGDYPRDGWKPDQDHYGHVDR